MSKYVKLDRTGIGAGLPVNLLHVVGSKSRTFKGLKILFFSMFLCAMKNMTQFKTHISKVSLN